jgi:hypothetical protein
MRILLRLLAVWTLLSVLATLLFVARVWKMGGIAWVLGTSPFAYLTALGWLITLAVGPPAVILLWRQREAGRRACIAFWGTICLYYLLSLTFFSSQSTQYGFTAASIFWSVVPVALLVSPQAKIACGSRKRPPDQSALHD